MDATLSAPGHLKYRAPMAPRALLAVAALALLVPTGAGASRLGAGELRRYEPGERRLRGLRADRRERARNVTVNENAASMVDGRTVPVQDMPHVWEHALFYLAAARLHGALSYVVDRTDAYVRACRSGAASRVACR
jgi:hypothetical protein